MHAGNVLCPQRAAARADASPARDAQATAAMQEEMAGWERQAVAALPAIPDPAKRGVRLIAAQLPHIHGPERSELMRAAQEIAVDDVLPGSSGRSPHLPKRSPCTRRTG